MQNYNEEIRETEEAWSSWKALAGYAYILICVFDFVVMPAVVHIGHMDTKASLIDIIHADDKKFALEVMDRVRGKPWSPITLIGAGVFHLAFGAILTGAAVTRSFERQEIVRSNNPRQPDRRRR